MLTNCRGIKCSMFTNCHGQTQVWICKPVEMFLVEQLAPVYESSQHEVNSLHIGNARSCILSLFTHEIKRGLLT